MDFPALVNRMNIGYSRYPYEKIPSCSVPAIEQVRIGVLFLCLKRVKRSKIEAKLKKRSTFSSAAYSTNWNLLILFILLRYKND